MYYSTRAPMKLTVSVEIPNDHSNNEKKKYGIAIHSSFRVLFVNNCD